MITYNIYDIQKHFIDFNKQIPVLGSMYARLIGAPSVSLLKICEATKDIFVGTGKMFASLAYHFAAHSAYSLKCITLAKKNEWQSRYFFPNASLQAMNGFVKGFKIPEFFIIFLLKPKIFDRSELELLEEKNKRLEEIKDKLDKKNQQLENTLSEIQAKFLRKKIQRQTQPKRTYFSPAPAKEILSQIQKKRLNLSSSSIKRRAKPSSSHLRPPIYCPPKEILKDKINSLNKVVAEEKQPFRTVNERTLLLDAIVSGVRLKPVKKHDQDSQLMAKTTSKSSVQQTQTPSLNSSAELQLGNQNSLKHTFVSRPHKNNSEIISSPISSSPIKNLGKSFKRIVSGLLQ